MTSAGAADEFAPGVEPGEILMDKYRVEAVLGRGGMGVVARARHLGLDEQVAIKFLRPDVVADQEACRRFLREAQAAVKLKSEHVARVSDVGTLPNGSPYMVMEFLEGVDLDQMVETSGVLAAPLAVDLMLQACEALGEAHALGIVHRDVKPANFFVTWRPDGTPLLKVLDFGISKAPVGVELSLTKTQSVLGTPAYMSPEQMRSARTVDARSDIWSLGGVLYELLCGHRPFDAETFSEMCVKVAVDPPEPFSVEVPAGLDAVVLRCLEKDPAARYQSMAELARALAPYARDQRAASIIVERIQRVASRRAPTQASADGVPLEQASSLRPGGKAAARTPAPGRAATPVPAAWAANDGRPTESMPPAMPAPRRTTPWGVQPDPEATAVDASAPSAILGATDPGMAPDGRLRAMTRESAAAAVSASAVHAVPASAAPPISAAYAAVPTPWPAGAASPTGPVPAGAVSAVLDAPVARRSPWGIVLAAIATLALVGGVVVIATRGGGDATTSGATEGSAGTGGPGSGSALTGSAAAGDGSAIAGSGSAATGSGSAIAGDGSAGTGSAIAGDGSAGTGSAIAGDGSAVGSDGTTAPGAGSGTGAGAGSQADDDSIDSGSNRRGHGRRPSRGSGARGSGSGSAGKVSAGSGSASKPGAGSGSAIKAGAGSGSAGSGHGSGHDEDVFGRRQ